MVVTVTLNPMIDKTVAIDRVRIGGITRATSLAMTVGGKGINVARQLKVLGEEVTAVTPAGGETGKLLVDLLYTEELPHVIVATHGRTREGVTYKDGEGVATAVFEPSGELTQEEVSQLVGEVESLIDGNDVSWLACSGSAPCREAERIFADLLSSAKNRGVFTALDSYGPVFRQALAQIPHLVHINRVEAADTLGSPIRTDADMMHATASLVERGVEYAILTNGADPFHAAWKSSRWRVVPPRVLAVNPVGSGDTLVAGVIHGLLKGWDWERALAFGAAAGSANASVWEVASIPEDTIQSLLPRVLVEKIC